MASELQQVIKEIKDNTKQVSINKVDEVRVMTAMLNDPEYKVGIYDKNVGHVGDRNPHENAVAFVAHVIAGATQLDTKDSQHLAENYKFTKRDATFMIENMRDFVDVYTKTGRKMNLVQNADSEANIFAKQMPAGSKSVPDKDKPGQTKTIKTAPYVKIVSQTKCPKYKTTK